MGLRIWIYTIGLNLGNVLIPCKCSGEKYRIRAVSGMAVDPVAPKKETEEPSTENWKVKMLYDGECPLCMREVSAGLDNLIVRPR